MSLDFCLLGEPKEELCQCGTCGHAHTREVHEELYGRNITGNLSTMAKEAGIYTHLWYPEDLLIVFAKQLIGPLRRGLIKLQADPEHFKQFDAPNGWGTYENFLPLVENVLSACEDNPEARVSVCR